MKEAGAVVGVDGDVLFWHVPDGRNGGYIPDSRQLWDVLWDNRESVSGFAHSHPGSGVPNFSSEDVTTFIAVEAALGRRLNWWIVNSSHIVLVKWDGSNESDKLSYVSYLLRSDPSWVENLRELSEIEGE